MRGQLDYSDQNDSFGSLLPVRGSLSPAPQPKDSQHRWFVLNLDSPLHYQGDTYCELLIASRWNGYAIEGDEPTSVFVLLIPHSTKLAPGFAVQELPHIAWGMWHGTGA